MGKTILIVGAILLALAIIVPVAVYYSSDAGAKKWVPKFAAANAPVGATVPLSVATVRAKLVEKLGAEFEGAGSFATLSRPEYGPQFKDYVVWHNENGSIDDEFRPTDTGFSSDAPISTKHLDLETQDPGLPAYLKLPIPARKNDLKLQMRETWMASEVQKNGKTLPYRSDYFLHLKSLAPDETQITILGSNATAVDGQRWSVIGDVFFVAPRRVENVLSVPPSPADKRALLDNLLKLLK